LGSLPVGESVFGVTVSVSGGHGGTAAAAAAAAGEVVYRERAEKRMEDERWGMRRIRPIQEIKTHLEAVLEVGEVPWELDAEVLHEALAEPLPEGDIVLIAKRRGAALQSERGTTMGRSGSKLLPCSERGAGTQAVADCERDTDTGLGIAVLEPPAALAGRCDPRRCAVVPRASMCIQLCASQLGILDPPSLGE
jgi:hypothetical protein